MDRTFLLERITVTKALIVAYEAAALALGTDGGVSSYSLDTGQTRQSVTAVDLPRINAELDSLYNRLTILQQRAGVISGVTVARPAW